MAKAPRLADVPAKADAVVPVSASTTGEASTPAEAGWSLEIGTPPYIVNGKGVAKLTLEPLMFAAWVSIMDKAAIEAAQSSGRNADGTARMAAFRKATMREQMRRRLKAWDANGAPIALKDGDILNLPRAYAMQALRHADRPPGGTAGEVLADGDGLNAPVLYRLGTPVRLAGPEGDLTIEEVEIQARTLGDIEDVLAQDTPASQALSLIATCAKPVGLSIPLQRLPTWALDQITIADGDAIAERILPRFLE